MPIRELVVGMLACWLAACSNDIDALLGDGPGDAAPDAVTPEQAATELFGVECSACVAQTCATEVSDCAADGPCAAEVLCRHACDDPACYGSCSASYPIGSRPSSRLEECGTGCAGDCAVARDFGCVGKYRWPDPGAAEQVLRLELRRFSTPETLPGIRVRVCASALIDPECKQWSSEARSGEDGRVELTLPSGRGANTGDYTPFGGFLEFYDPDNAPPSVVPTLLLLDFSWRDPFEHWITALFYTPSDLEQLDAARRSMGLSTRPPGTGWVAAVVHDCKGFETARAAGLTISVDGPSAGALYGLAGETETSLTGFATVLNVAAGYTLLTAFDAGTEVARFELPVRSDTVTYLWLYPRAIRPAY